MAKDIRLKFHTKKLQFAKALRFYKRKKKIQWRPGMFSSGIFFLFKCFYRFKRKENVLEMVKEYSFRRNQQFLIFRKTVITTLSMLFGTFGTSLLYFQWIDPLTDSVNNSQYPFVWGLVCLLFPSNTVSLYPGLHSQAAAGLSVPHNCIFVFAKSMSLSEPVSLSGLVRTCQCGSTRCLLTFRNRVWKNESWYAKLGTVT